MRFDETGRQIGAPDLRQIDDDRPLLFEEEPEEAPSREPVPGAGEDPVRAYLHDIGKVRLLTAAQEVDIGRRIEVAQAQLWRALAGIPLVVRALVDMGDKLRQGVIPPDQVAVLPEGGELDEAESRQPWPKADDRSRPGSRTRGFTQRGSTISNRSHGMAVHVSVCPCP